MNEHEIWVRLAVSLAIGLLVGMQRERQKEAVAGIRTFALAALLGTVCGAMAKELGALVVLAGFLAMTVTTAAGNFLDRARSHVSGVAGITTEVALLLVYALGVWLATGPMMAAVVVGGTTFVLLAAKTQLHGWTDRLQERDWHIIARFVLVSCVILPILPDETYGPFEVFNPRETWFMVVVIVGLGLAGFVAHKLFGEKGGLLASGLLGGVISSTATTVTASRAAKEREGSDASAAVVIVLASTVVYVRLAIEATIAAPGFSELRLPLVIMCGVSVVAALVTYLVGRRGEHQRSEPENPSQFRTAFVFAALYAIIAVASAAARHYWGDAGMYAVAGLSGLTDLDAITLATSRAVAAARMPGDDGWRVIVVALMSNLLFKSGVIMVLGTKKLFLRAGLVLVGSAVVGLILVLLL